MLKLVFFAAWFLLAGTLTAQNTIIHDPNAELRNAREFHAIEISGAINLYLNQGNEEAVAVSAKDIKYRDLIRTEVKNGILKIWFDQKGWRSIGGNKELKAYVSCKILDKLSASGASDVQVDGVISGKQMDVDLSGASDFKGSVQYNELNLHQSGASDVTIRGNVSRLTIQASGASDVKGYDLITDSCSVHASGASDIRVVVNKELIATARGASSINFKGSGVIKEVHSSGASNVSKEE